MGGKVSAQIDEAADSNAVELNLDSSKLSSLPKEVFARLRVCRGIDGGSSLFGLCQGVVAWERMEADLGAPRVPF